ncbi:hypothetical protein SAY87_021517 [Trapa incisa]|uniref:CCT-beta n=1 Tax=Trapa incisa TaxID=236973 RepID=A0AAN7PRM1_9MYRT|nr:hypothetical protein SAY87_021517 [Trapa incisa]
MLHMFLVITLIQLPDISKVQDDEVGDGTTSVVILAGELLREAEKLVAAKIHPITIISGYRMAAECARDALLQKVVDNKEDADKFRLDLMKIAVTTLSSKILYQDKDHFAKLAVDAVMRLKGSTNLEAIQIIKKPGGSLKDSFLDEGFILDKKIGIGQPKRIENAKILVANTAMDTDKVKIYGARVRVDSMSKVAEIEGAEKEKMKEKVKKIIAHGINCFVNRQLIYNFPEELFADAGILAIEHADFDGIERLALVTGGEIASTFDNPESIKLGHCKLIEEIMIGEDKLIHFFGVEMGQACTIVLRGASHHVLDEAERSLHDALCVLSQTVNDSRVLLGGGWPEMIMAKAVDELARQTPGKKSHAIEAFSKALLAIPTIIADNAGLDSAELIAKLRAEHHKEGCTAGIDVISGSVGDMAELGISEAFKVKQAVLLSATEAAEMILRVDETISCAPRRREDRMDEERAGMVAYCNDDLPPPTQPDGVPSQPDVVRLSKHVHDNVHGNIYLDPLCLKLLDTEQFQRQVRVTNLVYPGAVHSRFEHSLGVYWLAGKAVQTLKNCQGGELGIDCFDIQTVKIAGLLHDVGHGPFSHLFEREFLPRVLSDSKWSHEEMSVRMVDHIVDEHHIEVDPELLKRVKEMIAASTEHSSPKSMKEKLFLYDIVANGRNGIDVDKFDYIVRDCRACGLGYNFQFQRLMETMRVVGDEICYRAKDYLNIHKMFATRADLYRTVYTHPKVKAVELMIVDALVKANDRLQISSYIHDPREYWKLDDTIIKTIETTPDPVLKESRDLILRIHRRNLYQFCNEYAVPKENLDHFKDVTAQDIVCSQKNAGVTLKEEDVAVCNVRIDLTRGKHNPLESINFFKDYESDEKFTIADDRISHLLPGSYQDMIVRVYSKKPELVAIVSEAFENFQLRTYGIKAQVHATPEKKKRRL